MMHRTLDQERILHCMPKKSAPIHVVAHVRVIAATHHVNRAKGAAPYDLAQGRLVLVEAVAHRDRHFAARLAYLSSDADRARHRVGDGLFAEDVDTVGDRNVDHRLVELGRHDHGAEVGLGLRERFVDIGEAGAVRQAKELLAQLYRLRVGIHDGDYLDLTVGDVVAKEFLAPTAPEAADADVDHSLCHISPFPLPGPLVRACVPKDGRLAFRARGRFRRIRPARV